MEGYFIKQGILPLVFRDVSNYDDIETMDLAEDHQDPAGCILLTGGFPIFLNRKPITFVGYQLTHYAYFKEKSD